jgi:hypothetical protein
MEMGAEHRLLGNGERQFVNPAETRRQEDREPVLLMAPKILVPDKRSRWAQQSADFASPPFGVQPPVGLRYQVFEADRILADLAAGDLGRQIERNRRLRLAGEQFIQVFSEEHWPVPIGKRLYFPTPNRADRS